jgi:hypothetical protein
MSNGKAFTAYVCHSNVQLSMYIDANPHILACDNLKMGHSSCTACS